eukprot:comp20772_c1_seq1/m.27266 comp20772_c1_seq1/g.27266  ORF comp20772_c1_seq1/g.27266 comp20772_c1_seq1/m.27266 type:complete len:206 (-) comp20772_c1_seq1:832-1449(-)
MEAVYPPHAYLQAPSSPGTSLRCDHNPPSQSRYESTTSYQNKPYMSSTALNTASTPNFSYQYYYSEPNSPVEQRKPQNTRSPLVAQRPSESFTRDHHPYVRRSPSYNQYQNEKEKNTYSPREKILNSNSLSVVPVDGALQRRCQSLNYLSQYDILEHDVLPAKTEMDIYLVAERLGNALIDLQPAVRVAPPPLEHRKAFKQLFFL